MTHSLADQLQIWGFQDNYAIFSDGSLGFGIECLPVDNSCWDNYLNNSFNEQTSQFLNSLPAGIDVQFIQEIEPGNDQTLKAHQLLSKNSTNPIAKSLCEERVSRLNKLDELGSLPKHRLKIFVRRPLTQHLLLKPKIFSREKQFQVIAEERLRHEILNIERLKENLVNSLISLNLNPKQITTDEIIQILYHQWNPSRNCELQNYDPEDIRNSILFSDVGVDINGFCIGTPQFRIVSLKVMPDETFSGMMAQLRELPFKSKLFVTIQVPDQAKEIEGLKTQNRIAYSMAVGKKNIADIESKAKFDDLSLLLEQMVAQGQKVFNVSVCVVLQHEDSKELENQVDQTLALFRTLSGAEGLQETLANFNIFSQLAIPNARCKERERKIKTSNLCDLLPVYGPWEGHKTPRMLLRSRLGSLVGLDIFDPSLSSANQLIAGTSGSGKSALTNILLMQMLKENPKVYIVDIGGSYKKLTENLGGQYVPLDLNEKISLNPFDLNPGETIPSSEKIIFLLGLVELMTKEDGQERLPRLIRSEIEETIQQVYKKIKKPRLSDLRALLLENPNKDVQVYGRILSSWCGDSPFGKFLDRESNIQLHKDIVAFDLKGLDGSDLQPICLYIITDLVWREVQKDRSRMKFVIFDECWALLEDCAEFIELIFRTLRKFFASALAISQAIEDLLNSKIGPAILANCPIKWILKQSQNDHSKMKQAVGLNDTEIELIKSLHQEKGKYSEAFLVAGDLRTLAVIEPTPLELWIATTDPRDLAVLEKFKKDHPHLSQLDVLKELSKKYPYGTVAA